MNKLVTTHLGRMPIVLDDLRWIEEANKEIFAGIVKHDTSNPLIVSGCSYDKNSFAITQNLVIAQGFVYWNNEIYRFDGDSLTLATGESLYWIIDDTTFALPGVKTFGDSSVHNVYQERSVYLTKATSAPTGGIPFSSTKYIFELYKTGIATHTIKTDPFISLLGSFAQTTDSPLKAWINIDGSVSLVGELKTPSGGYSVGTVGTLASDYRPAQTRRITYDLYNSGSDPLARGFMTLNSSGILSTTNTLPLVNPPANAILKFNEVYNL